MKSNPFHGKTEKWAILSALSELNPGTQPWGVLICLLIILLFVVILWDSWMQAPLALRNKWIGSLFLSVVLKFGLLHMWSIPLSPLWKLDIEGSLPIVRHYSKGGFMIRVCPSASYPLQCGYFLNHPMCGIHSTNFWISLTGYWSMCSCICGASVGGGKFRSLYWHLGDVLQALHGNVCIHHIIWWSYSYPLPQTSMAWKQVPRFT